MNRFHTAKPVFLAIATLVFAVFTPLARAQSATPVTGATAAPSAAPAAPTLVAKIAGNLNTKSAKIGDSLAAKTVKELKLKDIDIPKGSKIVGKVVSVQSMQAGSGTSALGIKFDQVELKGGAVLPIRGLIVAIGASSDSPGLGYNSVLGRGGVGSTPGMDPHPGGDTPVDRDDSNIPSGSTLEGVGLGLHLDAAGASELRGVHRDINLDSDVMIKVALFRGSPHKPERPKRGWSVA